MLGDEIQSYKIRAFPTYVLFNQTAEAGRISGVNFDGIKALVAQHCKSHDFGQGASLGGANAGNTISVEDARARRLARFGGGGNGNVPGSSKADDIVKDDADGGGEEECVYNDEDNDEEMKDAALPTADDEAATEEAKEDDKMDVDEPAAGKKESEKKDDNAAEVEMVDPTADLKEEDVKTLTEEYGFPLIRAQKGLLNGGGTVEGAASWLCEHLEDADIDEPIEKVPKKLGAVKSYRCVATGKLFTDMVAMEFYANKTGRTEFEECTEEKKPLTPEEKAAKIAEIKSLLKAKRMQREETEKTENVDREKQRRFMGKEMIKTREQMEIDQRKRMAQQRKKEKEAAIRERQRIKAELEKDKRERAANKGKLKSKLGVDGYNPDAIQYEVDEGGAGQEEGQENKKPKKAPPSVAKIDEYLAKVSSYRAGGDGGNCLKILKAYLGNVVKNPEELKFKKINMENKAYRTKVKPFL